VASVAALFKSEQDAQNQLLFGDLQPDTQNWSRSRIRFAPGCKGDWNHQDEEPTMLYDPSPPGAPRPGPLPRSGPRPGQA